MTNEPPSGREASFSHVEASAEELREAALLICGQLATGLIVYPLIAFSLALFTRLGTEPGVGMTPIAFGLWSGLAVTSVRALGAAGPSMLEMVVVVGSSCGGLVVWAPFLMTAYGVVACFLVPPIVASLWLEDPESRVLAIILSTLALFSAGVVRHLHNAYWLGVSRLRDLKRALEEAERANSAKTDFLANVSHEIRTPMVGIVGPAEILVRSGLSPEQTRHVRLILSSTRVLGNLIDTLLDVAKIEAGEAQLEVSRLDLRSTLIGSSS